MQINLRRIDALLDDNSPKMSLSDNWRWRATQTQPTRYHSIRAEGPVALTGLVESDGRRSDTGGAPIVRFFVAAISAPSLVSTLESDIDHSNRKETLEIIDDGHKHCVM